MAEDDDKARFLQIARRLAGTRDEAEEREKVHVAFLAKQEAQARARTAQRIVREKEAAERRRKEKEEARREEAKAKGIPLWWCFVDLGGTWSRRWLYENVAFEVPEVMHAGIPEDLTCTAVREGLEAVRKARRQKRQLENEVQYLVAAAAAFQASKPKVLLPQHEALKRPELICPHKL